MAFRRPHPRRIRTCEEHKAELEEENYHLRSELQTEVDTNRRNEKQIRDLDRDYDRCVQEIQTLNGEIERLENASKEEIVELKSKISSLKSRLYQAKKDVRDKGKYISDLEKRLDESEEQAQIFALQNNLPDIGMAGYAPKRFSGDKQRALELFRSCLTDEASRWVEKKLIGKKWRLNHVRCGNNLANMAAVVALNNANITAAMINAPDGTPPPGLPAGATGATVIPAHNVHVDKDWSLAGGCPVDAGTATNAPNGATNNNNQIVLPDINISQVIYWFKRNYPTVVREQQELIFGTLTQGSDSVRNFYRKIDKYASWAQISDREKRIQFIRGLSPENKLEMKRLGLNRPLDDDLIEILEEIETARNNLLLGEDIYNQPATKTKPKVPSHQNITTEDIDRIVNSRIQALQQSTPNQSPASSSDQENITRADLQEAIAKSFQETMSRATKTLDNNDYNYDPVDDITDSMAGMTLNNATINAIKSAVKSAVKKKCTKCGRFGHTSQPDSDSDSSDTSSSDSSDSDSSSDDSSNSGGVLDVHMAKAKKNASGQNDILASSIDSDESNLEEESLDDPMEIDFVKKKEPKTSVATVECKIKRLKIPAMTLDSGAEPPIITENIVERTGAKIDKSKIHDLEGISTVPTESIGVVRNLPITLTPGLTIIEDFIVMRYHKPTLIFFNQLLKKYRCAVDWATNELKIPLNGKDYIIPVTMHKIKNKLEVNCATTTSECDDLSTPDKISQDLQDLSEDETLKKK
ncbi:hypothetical protein GLOIN_2v1886689 [Rhizophagus clarus]|uniref:Uncharacterized protein n=1 Tax=Rhizophagus clarus TaxID=94130 RepID=A0A8H3KZY9_9GLOM|nr:hypothetical protein GLOIN_2v1886689 [Rhizophagus clarus]